MGRVPTPAEVSEWFAEHLDAQLADGGLVLTAEQRQLVSLHGAAARDRLVSLTTAMHSAAPPVAEAVATVLHRIGRELAPTPPPQHAPRLRIHKSRQHRRKR